MRASALTLFAAGALAVPRVLNHVHQHHERELVVDYTTVVETNWVTKYMDGPTAAANDEGAAGTACTSSATDAPTPPPVAPGAGSPYNIPGDISQASQGAPDAPATKNPLLSLNPIQTKYGNAPVLSRQQSVQQQAEPTGGSAAAPSGDASVGQSTTQAAAPTSNPYSGRSSVNAPSSTQPTTSPSSSPPATSTGTTAPGSLPFKNMVIFGDNLSDRGNGSSDHNVAGDPETIYGFKTWTDGPIAAEVLADSMQLPILYDFAYGHADGGSKFGATVDNSFTKSDANAPSAVDQIANYTKSPYYDQAAIAHTLHFLWIGNNDVLPWLPTPVAHLNPAAGADDAGNTQFASTLAQRIADQASALAKAGAEHIFVPNVYNRHVAPVVQRYFSNDTNFVEQYGKIIQNVNAELKTNLASVAQSTGKKVTYYDAFQFLMDAYTAAVQSGANGINMMKPGQNICDGAFIDPVPGGKSLAYCNQGHGDQFYWMQYLDPTAHVHRLLAADMQSAIESAYGA